MSVSLMNLFSQYLSQNNENKVNKLYRNSLDGKQSDEDVKNAAASFAFQQVYTMMINSVLQSENNQDFASALIGQVDTDGITNSFNNYGYYNSSLRNSYNLNYKYLNLDSSNEIGGLSSKYESNSNPGVIANNPGDPGGKSYGAWQFSANMGSLDSYVNWLRSSNNKFYRQLAAAKVEDENNFGVNFDSTWKRLAKENGTEFLKSQRDYVKSAFYDVAAKKLKDKLGFNIDEKTSVLKDVLWSTVVQHGVGGAVSIFSKINLKGTDAQIIENVYNERQKVNTYFRSSSEQIKRSVYNRFEKEKNDALSLV